MFDNAYQFLSGKHLAVDFGFAVSQWQNYQSKIDLVKSGIPLREVFESKTAPKLEILIPSFKDEVAGIKSLQLVGAEDQKNLSSIFTDPSFAVLDLNGFMSVDDGMYSYGANTYADLISKLEVAPKVLGILLRIDSGGGESMAGQIWFDALKEFRSSGKPVVALGQFVASAAYKAASAANEIIANSRIAEFGSIGTMMSFYLKVIETYKTQIMDLYASKSPKKNYQFREMLKGNNDPYIEKLDQMASIFQETIAQNRPLKGDIADTLSGDMFFADEAKSRGLIDRIGGMKMAVQVLKEHLPNDKKLLI